MRRATANAVGVARLAPLEPRAIARRGAVFVVRAITAVTKVAKRVSIFRSERGQMALPALPPEASAPPWCVDAFESQRLWCGVDVRPEAPIRVTERWDWSSRAGRGTHLRGRKPSSSPAVPKLTFHSAAVGQLLSLVADCCAAARRWLKQSPTAWLRLDTPNKLGGDAMPGSTQRLAAWRK